MNIVYHHYKVEAEVVLKGSVSCGENVDIFRIDYLATEDRAPEVLHQLARGRYGESFNYFTKVHVIKDGQEIDKS